MSDLIKPEDVHIRVIDQLMGMGISNRDTVIRIFHKPSGIIVEVPRITSTQFYDREIAMQMLEAALTHPKYREDAK